MAGPKSKSASVSSVAPVRPQISIREAARRSGLSFGYVNRVVNGHRDPRLSAAKKLAKAFHMSLDMFVRYIAEKSAEQVQKKLDKATLPEVVSEEIEIGFEV
jgi:transcriptional regulator with XRE-family HTH domain